MILTPLLQITESCRTCVCGHVLEDVKAIAGKRFSGKFTTGRARLLDGLTHIYKKKMDCYIAKLIESVV